MERELYTPKAPKNVKPLTDKEELLLSKKVEKLNLINSLKSN